MYQVSSRYLNGSGGDLTVRKFCRCGELHPITRNTVIGVVNGVLQVKMAANWTKLGRNGF